MNDIEPRIRPLVEVLNRTGVVQTFSSCEGHFEPDQQQLRDRNHAEVRFVAAPGVSHARVEGELGRWLAQFKGRYGLLPVSVVGYKLFTPLEEAVVEQTFVLELRPFNRLEPAATKRADIDRSIGQLARLIGAAGANDQMVALV